MTPGEGNEVEKARRHGSGGEPTKKPVCFSTTLADCWIVCGRERGGGLASAGAVGGVGVTGGVDAGAE